MAFPALVSPEEQWLYVSNTVAILGNSSTINPNPPLPDELRAMEIVKQRHYF